MIELDERTEAGENPAAQVRASAQAGTAARAGMAGQARTAGQAGTEAPSTPGGHRLSRAKARRRRWKSRLAWGSAWLATALVLFGVADLLGTLLWKGVASFRWEMLITPTQGIAGGLENAILGTLELIVISTAIAAPLGILGGIYVAEFARRRTAAVVRFLTEVLSGVPSIVIGYFGYLWMVLKWGWGFSALAGGVALTVIMLPYILRTTESSLQQVPLAQREAAWALGLTRFQAIARVIVRPAAAGIATGVLMAIAIGMGETAPLLYTAGWSTMNPTGQLTHEQVGYLTYVVWSYIDQPYPAAHALAYSAALVLLSMILFIHVVVRAMTARLAVGRSGRSGAAG